MSSAEGRPVGRWARAEAGASPVAFLCLDSEYVNGVVLPVDGGRLAR